MNNQILTFCALIMLNISSSYATSVEIKPEHTVCKHDYECMRIDQDCCENVKIIGVNRTYGLDLIRKQSAICDKQRDTKFKAFLEERKNNPKAKEQRCEIPAGHDRERLMKKPKCQSNQCILL